MLRFGVLVWVRAGLVQRGLARSWEAPGGAGKARTPERWPQSAWGVLERALSLTSASVKDGGWRLVAAGCWLETGAWWLEAGAWWLVARAWVRKAGG